MEQAGGDKSFSIIKYLFVPSLRGSFLETPDSQILDEVEEECNEIVFEPIDTDSGAEHPAPHVENDDEPKFDDFYEGEQTELGEQELWKCTQPITAIKDISRKIKSRRGSERRRSSELSDSEAKDLIRLQRSVNVMKGGKKSSGDKFFWDEFLAQEKQQSREAP